MAAQDDKKGLSRRALRRARAEAEDEADATEERDSDAGEDESEADDEDAEADDEDAEADDEDAEEPAPRPPSGARKRVGKSKRKRRAPSGIEVDEEDSDADKIRDRNRRVRERAAAARRARRKEREVAATQGLDASELMDDALARTSHAVVTWVRKNFTLMQWILVLAVGGGMAWLIIDWRLDRAVENRSDALTAGVDAEYGRVTEDGNAPANTPFTDRRKNFNGHEARLTAAAAAYQEAADESESKATTILARLGLAGALYDLSRFDEALEHYGAVKLSKLAERDPDVKGRAIEGEGLCLEAKKDLDGALRAFGELENTETPGFIALARYHRARLMYAKGEKDKALEILKQAGELLAKARGKDRAPGFLDLAARELQFTIDPESALTSATIGSMDPEKFREQLRRAQEMAEGEKNTPLPTGADLEDVMRDPEKLKKLLGEMGINPDQQGSAAPAPEPAPAPSQ